MSDALQTLRKEWEGQRWEENHVFTSPYGERLVVGIRTIPYAGEYATCWRYFMLGGTWQVSEDKSHPTTPEDALTWLAEQLNQ